MSKNRECALLLGIGSIDEVLSVSTNLPSNQAYISVGLSTIGVTVKRLLEADDGFSYLAPLLCAILNTQFHRSGDFYRVSSNGGIERNYFTTDDEREVIEMLAGI